MILRLADTRTICQFGDFKSFIAISIFFASSVGFFGGTIHPVFSTIYDAYQSFDLVYNFGTGLVLKRVAGFGNSIYDMSVDYNYTMYPYPRAEDPSHTISVSFLGQSIDQRPVVLTPKRSFSTSRSVASFSGTADENAEIYIYNGNLMAN